MKDAEIDWLVYHRAAGLQDTDLAGLVRDCGLSEDIIAASLQRLEGNLLVECHKGRVKVLSINESLIRCQVKYDPALPFTIENGVIREKKR